MPSFVCSLCGNSYPYEEHRQRCPADGEPLHIQLDPSNGKEPGTDEGLLRRWRQFLPFQQTTPDMDLGVGNTPLIKARKLGEMLGMEQLFFKNEGLNPTGSFKDRGSLVGMQRALDMGFRAVGTVSSGNMAGSMAAFAARAGLECFVMVSSGIPPEKLGSIGIYRPHLTKVDGDYGDIYYESLKIGQEMGIYFITGDDPFRVEGQKTVVLEICEQMAQQPPDYIFVPTSSGGNASGILKGLLEMEEGGMLPKRPKVVVVQAEGASAIAKAFSEGKQTFDRLSETNTICHAISNPNPPSGNRVLRWLEGGRYGWAMTVTDDEALAAQAQMAEVEGIWAQADSAVPLAAIRKALKEGRIDPSSRVVAIVTGNGNKDTSVFKLRPVETTQVPLDGLHDHVASMLKR